MLEFLEGRLLNDGASFHCEVVLGARELLPSACFFQGCICRGQAAEAGHESGQWERIDANVVRCFSSPCSPIAERHGNRMLFLARLNKYWKFQLLAGRSFDPNDISFADPECGGRF